MEPTGIPEEIVNANYDLLVKQAKDRYLVALLDGKPGHGHYISYLLDAGEKMAKVLSRADLTALRSIERVHPDAYKFGLLGCNYVPQDYDRRVIAAMLMGYTFDEVRAALKGLLRGPDWLLLQDEEADASYLKPEYRSPTQKE
tara:strand:+ start:1566 stop:1994 length:429 start_codon:yes stop_codon:yes gene_type:complete